MQQALVNDIETLLLGYLEEHELASASVDERFQHLRSRIHKRYKDMWTGYREAKTGPTFYSDCEHEITTVTKGHRITLTYNLYIIEPVGAGLLPSPLTDPSNSPLHRQIKMVLEQPGFFTLLLSFLLPAPLLVHTRCPWMLMAVGGVLGFFCSHSYAHTSRTGRECLPRTLKGSDLSIFAVLKSLGLSLEVLPVLEHNGDYFATNELELSTAKSILQESAESRTRYISTDYYYDEDAL
ncbi:hypothetical protein VTO42DRAFT_1587 [Malbranchea cinnamomea]